MNNYNVFSLLINYLSTHSNGGTDESSDVSDNTIVAFSQTCPEAMQLCTHLSIVHFRQNAALALDAVFTHRRNLLIQGPAGCGKTTLTNRIFKEARRRFGSKPGAVVMLAPTQAAAELLEIGQTIHSFLHIRKTETLETLEYKYDRFLQHRRAYASIFDNKDEFPSLIIVDEISMCGIKLLTAMDFILRRRKGGREDVIFGGACVVCVGDFCQLPPVCDQYAFTWPQWSDFHFVKVLLERPLRHNGDRQWFHYLQRVRCGGVRYFSSSDGGPSTISDAEYEIAMHDIDAADRPIILSAENKAVEELNDREFRRVPTPLERTLIANDYLVRRITGDHGRTQWVAVNDEAATDEDLLLMKKSWRLQTWVPLKIGAKYVITQNLNKTRGIYNGKTCIYAGNSRFRYYNANTNQNDFVTVDDLRSSHMMPTGRFPDLYIMREQVALRLGYAQTIHKSQGMTMDKVILDLRKIRCPGQYYVACSRVRSRDDIRVRNPTTGKLQVSGQVLAYVFAP